MFYTLMLYLLNYGLVFSFGIAATDENILKSPDTSFHVFEDCIHHSYNDAGALLWPNGITIYLQSPCLVRRAVFHPSPAAILIMWYPFFRSNLVNHFPSLVLSSNSLISPHWYLFRIVRRFSALQSTQSLIDTSFFCAKRIRAAAAEQARCTFPVGMFPAGSFRRLCLLPRWSCRWALQASLPLGDRGGSVSPRTCVQEVWLPVWQKSIMHNESIVYLRQ